MSLSLDSLLLSAMVSPLGSGADPSDDDGANYCTRAAALVERLTLEEKARLLTGDGWWRTHAIERIGIPSIMMTDGPHGLRKETGHGLLSRSVPATCFPPAATLASSWDRELVRDIGVALGVEAQANEVQILLGPGVNMKRSPLGGRNFEYFSEDPVLAGALASAYILGVQSQGVGTSIKHYAANNQELERMAMSSNVDERALHEIYLTAFEIAIKAARPWTVMCAYNRVNGVYASESPLLLQEILRDRWGFQGFVVSDWGAVNDRVAGVNAGNHLEMPGSGDYNRDKIIAGVERGDIPAEALNRRVAELLAVVLEADAKRRPETRFEPQLHHALARQAAAESIVLLKNEGGILPVDPRRCRHVALIGAFAKSPRYQGAGSSQVNPTKLENAFDELTALAGGDVVFGYAPGYAEDGSTSDALLTDAQRQARDAELAVVFVGLPDSYESEGFDRATLNLPEGHERLIRAVAEAQPNVVVVLMGGSAMAMRWLDHAKAVLVAWLGGQAGGGAVAEVLTGRVNPSGKLAETLPRRLEDTPPYPNFPARGGEAEYGEGVFIGYRYYDSRKIEPLFPFGYGLSYTRFAYTDLRLGASRLSGSEPLTASVTVRNTGAVAGKEIVQLYVHERAPRLPRPENELKGFAKVALAPGEEQTVTFTLDGRAFSYYDPGLHDWVARPGEFEIRVGGSSRQLPLQQTVHVETASAVAPRLTRSSMLKDFLVHPKGKEFYPELAKASGIPIPEISDEPGAGRAAEAEAELRKARLALMSFLNDMPVSKLPAFSAGKFSELRLGQILREVQS